MFIIHRDSKGNSGAYGKRSREPDLMYVLIHTDDFECIGSTEEILEDFLNTCKLKWTIKEVNAGYLLGVKREVSYSDEGDMEITMTMTAFVEGMMTAFEQWKYGEKKNVTTPVPDGFFITKNPKNTEGADVLARGYQRLLGMLLWAARGVFPECLLGTSLLGRVMADPTDEAWKGAVHMLNYMHQHRFRGIKFSAAGNGTPIAFSDASNKGDPNDSKCQYGFVHMWQGGTIIAASRKLPHVGLSAAHNEYMALHWANRAPVWLRSLLEEMELHSVIQEPTLTFGDNRAANTLCEQDIITRGNQFIRTPYHYNKEVVEAGYVSVKWIATAHNLADVFTKAVSKQVLEKLGPKVTGIMAIESSDVMHLI